MEGSIPIGSETQMGLKESLRKFHIVCDIASGAKVSACEPHWPSCLAVFVLSFPVALLFLCAGRIGLVLCGGAQAAISVLSRVML